MNDYAFGNYICALRRNAALSQSKLAERLEDDKNARG